MILSPVIDRNSPLDLFLGLLTNRYERGLLQGGNAMPIVENASVTPAYLTSDQTADKYNVSRGTMRWWLLQREMNGLNRAVIKIGRLVRINEQRFVEWLEGHLEAD